MHYVPTTTVTFLLCLCAVVWLYVLDYLVHLL